MTSIQCKLLITTLVLHCSKIVEDLEARGMVFRVGYMDIMDHKELSTTAKAECIVDHECTRHEECTCDNSPVVLSFQELVVELNKVVRDQPSTTRVRN